MPPKTILKIDALRPIRPFLLAAAIIGFVAINCPFLYFAFIEKEVYAEAMSNGLALVFIGEAFLLMVLIAFLIARTGCRPGWFFFIAMSLVGSLAFSIPLQLYLMTKPGVTSGDTLG